MTIRLTDDNIHTIKDVTAKDIEMLDYIKNNQILFEINSPCGFSIIGATVIEKNGGFVIKTEYVKNCPGIE